MVEEQIKKAERAKREFDNLGKIAEKEKALKAKYAKLNEQIKHNNAKKRKARTRALCQVGGFLFSEIANWTGENEIKIGEFDYDYFCKWCRNNKEALAQAFKTNEEVNNIPISNNFGKQSARQNDNINNSREQYYQQF